MAVLTRRKFIKLIFSLIIGIIILDSLFFEIFFIQLKNIYLLGTSYKTNNIKLIQVSDLHLQAVNFKHKQLAKKINALRPHLLLITGDAIDKRKNITSLNTFLQLLDKKIDKVAILGNWEYWGKIDLKELAEIYFANNCTLLVNEQKKFTFNNKTITITGIDDFAGGKADFAAAVKSYQKTDYHIVLNHCPLYSDYIATQLSETTKVDFILSGHTHGGQVNLLGYSPFLPFGSGKYLKGWYQNGGTKMYVSKGIGTSILPVRLGARAEVAVFYLPA
jgi:uncharacterized protein